MGLAAPTPDEPAADELRDLISHFDELRKVLPEKLSFHLGSYLAVIRGKTPNLGSLGEGLKFYRMGFFVDTALPFWYRKMVFYQHTQIFRKSELSKSAS